MSSGLHAPLLSELKWFVSQRWRAGAVVTGGALLSALWMDWSSIGAEILGVGLFILLYNAMFCCVFRGAASWLDSVAKLQAFAWVQIILDLACLTMLTVLTGGLFSPLLGLFVLHMVFASMLLQPPRGVPYLALGGAAGMMTVGLGLTDQGPSTDVTLFIAAGWLGTLLITIYVTTHIHNNLQANRDRVHAVLDAAADAVLSIDRRGRIELANPAAITMFGYQQTQIVGMPIEDLMAKSNLAGAGLEPTDGQVDEQPGEQEEGIGFAIRSDGTRFPVEVSLSNMALGRDKAVTVVVRDVTERQETEATLKALNSELAKHQEQLVQHEKMVAVGMMAAGVAHEIANPLANMEGLMQIVERNPDRMKEDTPVLLRQQIVRITNIVRQLKDFAHPAELDRESVMVGQLVQSALELMRFDKRHQFISVDFSEPESACTVVVHLQSIQQVLVNLIVNALDAACEKPRPEVYVRAEIISERECRVCIEDNGPGIPQEHIDRIFEPFYTTKPLGQGTGLGLSVSYSMVNRDGGRIEIESGVGQGTRVYVYLPRNRA